MTVSCDWCEQKNCGRSRFVFGGIEWWLCARCMALASKGFRVARLSYFYQKPLTVVELKRIFKATRGAYRMIYTEHFLDRLPELRKRKP